MRLLAVLLAVLVFAPLGLRAAEDVAVVSGEHDTYARLVFSISPDRAWNLKTTATAAELQFPAQDLDFDLSAVFARIPKTRLLAIKSYSRMDSSIVEMTLACDCSVRVFAYLGEYIVVDIVDADPTTVAIGTTRHIAPELRTPQKSGATGRVPAQISWNTPSAPRYASGAQTVNFPPVSGLAAEQQTDSLPPTQPTDQALSGTHSGKNSPSENLQEAVDVARESLLKQLTFAAEYGLVDLTGPPPKQPDEISIPPTREESPVVNVPADEHGNQLVVQSVYERDANAAGRGGENPENHCPSSEALDIASWGSGTNFSEEISTLRQSLLMEFDEPDYKTAEKLVKAYLRYGFGAEAESYLNEYGEKIDSQRLFLDMAAVVDGYTIPENGPLSLAVGCEGAAGIWTMVGRHPNVETQIGNADTLIKAFSELPPDIRKLLGPRLVAALIGRNLGDSARLIADLLERAPGEHGEAHVLAIGNLMQIEGDESGATKMFETLSDGWSEASIDALIKIARISLSNGSAPTENLLTDLGAASKTWQGTDRGAILKQLKSLWTAKLGMGASAVDQLLEAIEFDPASAGLFRGTVEDILDDFSDSDERSSDFPEMVNRYLENISAGSESDGLRLKIARRLLKNALPDFAIEVLQPPFQRGDGDAMLLIAQAHIAALRPEAALKLLEGQSGDAPRPYRVEAHLRTANFDAALAEMANLDGFVVQPHWFAGDWGLIAKTNTAAAAIAERMFPKQTPTFEQPAPVTLSSAQELLDLSHQENFAIRQMVARP